MHRLFVQFALGALFLTLLAVPAGAAPVKDEANLARETARLDRTAATPPGEAAVRKRIRKDLGVEANRVQALREQGLGYGELTVVLSLARKMPGGATPENVARVIALRRGPPVSGWGRVAKRLGFKLGGAVSQIRKVNNAARREMKKESAVRRAPRDETPAARPEGERSKAFTGEGKGMTRGRAAD